MSAAAQLSAQLAAPQRRPRAPPRTALMDRPMPRPYRLVSSRRFMSCSGGVGWAGRVYAEGWAGLGPAALRFPPRLGRGSLKPNQPSPAAPGPPPNRCPHHGLEHQAQVVPELKGAQHADHVALALWVRLRQLAQDDALHLAGEGSGRGVVVWWCGVGRVRSEAVGMQASGTRGTVAAGHHWSYPGALPCPAPPTCPALYIVSLERMTCGGGAYSTVVGLEGPWVGSSPPAAANQEGHAARAPTPHRTPEPAPPHLDGHLWVGAVLAAARQVARAQHRGEDALAVRGVHLVLLRRPRVTNHLAHLRGGRVRRRWAGPRSGCSRSACPLQQRPLPSAQLSCTATPGKVKKNQLDSPPGSCSSPRHRRSCPAGPCRVRGRAPARGQPAGTAVVWRSAAKFLWQPHALCSSQVQQPCQVHAAKPACTPASLHAHTRAQARTHRRRRLLGLDVLGRGRKDVVRVRALCKDVGLRGHARAQALA